MKKFYHDTHLHLDLYKNTYEIIEYINSFKSYTIAVTNLPILYERAMKTFPKSKYIRFAVGFHPELIQQFSEQIPLFYEKIKKSRYIGEIGLDFSKKNINSKELQIQVFTETVKICNKIGGKILTIHSRNAAETIIDIIGVNFNGKIILHWFSGGLKQLQRAIQYGYYFSINQEMVRSKNGREIISRLPEERILIESDGPFTRGINKDYKVQFIDDIVQELCHIKNYDVEKIYELLKNNFKELLN
ncbi:MULTISPECIES: Qat anti-phage system TatD family nuclease QatD [Bacillus cereus group]|uniref:TatD family deoxyribonuclease n=1 Tax=Bacillus thuringiensis serovar mexicanensis TaxID=180868 RepID=A0A242VZS8_BACTU|nr:MULTISPECIES: Qat anti-phage system TatD family nuclease QatD [Bacillus cereus group]MEB9672731.1 TatD family hydrolase [Bacillus anthracis]OTW44670.1 TatD family deoxyribonuclease [Bacillus thuringiensis serovar mexicanensis]OTW97022.1 TatD family deoxyribonuclease [Bacillus thuringiensis serovar monterrey]